jgi:hypothetical protein
MSLSWVLYDVRQLSIRHSDPSHRGVLLIVVCVNVIEKPYRGGLGPLGLSSHDETGLVNNNNNNNIY